jgi:hypothetical protein
MAVPRCDGDQISPRTPPVFVTGADPNRPAKNLQSKMVWMSFAVAVPNEKHAAMKYGARTAGFLPYLFQINIIVQRTRERIQPPTSREFWLTLRLRVPIITVLIQTQATKNSTPTS